MFCQEQRKAKSCSKFRAMLIIFFNIQGITMAEWIHSGQTVNQQSYKQVLEKFHESVGMKHPEFGRIDEFAPGQCASPHCVFSQIIFGQ